ncbi:unnamed protein product [Auanema sp. JU1783]|nr:unnamed protein product [Auanema sp. JU1783]
MVDQEELLGAVHKVFLKCSECTVDDLSKACRFCATDEACVIAIDDDQVDLPAVSRQLLEVALEGRADDESAETTPINIRRGRLALRIFINAANRSLKFRSAIHSDCVNLWRVLIRIPDFYVEVCASLVAASKEMHNRFALMSDYTRLLSDLSLLWEKTEERSWLTAFFSIILENDYAFLSHSFADFDAPAFCSLLRITETIVDSSETDVILRVHPNNISFCVALVERILFDFEEGYEASNVPVILESLTYTIDIIGSVALVPANYKEILLDKPSAVELFVDLLHSVLDAQSVFEKEMDEAAPRKSYPDRPTKPVPTRIPKVQESKSLLALSNALQANSSHILGLMKYALVRAIGNLCCDSAVNRVAAGANGAVIMVLACTRTMPFDKPFIMQWSIAALRYLCVESIENQEILLSIEQKPSGVINREKLFDELGIHVEMDKDGRAHIRKK